MPINFDKVFELLKVIVGALFAGIAILGLFVPIDEQTIINLLDILALILKPIFDSELASTISSLIFGAVAGLPALLRMIKGKKLTKVDKNE